MNNTSRIKLRLKTLTLISIVLMTSIFGMVLISNKGIPLEENSINNDQANEVINKYEPKVSFLGNHSWWDKSFHSRRIINITNPYSVGFKDFAVSINFKYSDLVAKGDLNSSLKDIRIIEYDSEGTPYQRKYYFKIDYPVANNVTVWFNTNITAGPDISELDT